jgi:hypothetical protein
MALVDREMMSRQFMNLATMLMKEYSASSVLEALEECATIVRFWCRVKKQEGCWAWLGYKNKFGYGTFSTMKELTAHRIAWILTNGSIPDGLNVLHKCDTAECCNPEHLYLGSTPENHHDMISRRRAWWFDKRKWRHGEDSNRAILSNEQVLQIRHRYSSGLITQNELAQEFGVCRSTIGYAISGKNWSHLEDSR